MRCWLSIVLLFFVVHSSCDAQSAQTDSKTAVILNDHSPEDYKQAVGVLNEAPGIEVIHHHDPVIHFGYNSESERISALELLYNRGYGVTMKDGFPVDFPLLPSGPEQNQLEAYQEQKVNWIEANPEQYEELQQPSGLTVIPQQEFDTLPPEKQQNILDHPELYSVE